ncbi:MAG TPA: AAA family ATPase [Ktedonobacterales bacterium]|nr:AAA family ATPase [Ktedonobacterales bacterium]
MAASASGDAQRREDPQAEGVAATVVATRDDFEAIFRYPTLEKMLALSWRDFERFIAHVFTCAGYHVEDVARDFFPDGPGVDLNLYAGPSAAKPVARVEIKRWRQQLQLDHVRQFIGTLRIAGDIPGYLVSTGGFADRAQIAAEMAHGHVRLIDGDRLLRYIAYVGGSRLNGLFAGRAVAPAQPLSPAWLEQGDLFAQRTARRSSPSRTARVLSVANIKGGVAKTTSALNIALALSDLHHQRVLLVDLDGQASLTRSLPAPPVDGPESPAAGPAAGAGVAGRRASARTTPATTAPPERDTATLADYLRGSAALAAVIRPTRFPRVWLAPAAHDLYRLQIAGADRAQLELALAEAIRTATVPGAPGGPDGPGGASGERVAPDWIILDTPAGDTFYARAALVAADHILIPAYPETYGAFGLDETLQLIRTMNALTASTVEWRRRLLGCIVTRWKSGTNATANLAALKTLLANERVRLFRQLIPLDERVEAAHRGAVKGERRGLFHLSAQPGPAALAYDAVVQEIQELTTHAN